MVGPVPGNDSSASGRFVSTQKGFNVLNPVVVTPRAPLIAPTDSLYLISRIILEMLLLKHCASNALISKDFPQGCPVNSVPSMVTELPLHKVVICPRVNNLLASAMAQSSQDAVVGGAVVGASVVGASVVGAAVVVFL